ncbi:hypothetical protein ACFU6S_34115 [Streptomyces sp. NPDC057456]|uniref:hypothetical protein n=1 Tax=Streptomyces sp. NPDC057456 TaxID=3346139 RepID=UPI00367CE828
MAGAGTCRRIRNIRFDATPNDLRRTMSSTHTGSQVLVEGQPQHLPLGCREPGQLAAHQDAVQDLLGTAASLLSDGSWPRLRAAG